MAGTRITQPRTHGAMTGRRYGSFGSKTSSQSGVNPSAVRVDLIGSAARFTLKGSPARAGTLEGSEARV